MAALLHDIGHGPMSHKFDDFTLTKDQFLEIVESDEDLLEYRKSFRKFLNREKVKDKARVDHEVISCLFVLKLVKDLKRESKDNKHKFGSEYKKIIENIRGENIVKMIEPEFDFPGIKIGKYDFTNFFSSIISSFPIDVDRMDYLLRDSYFSGVNYGLYDLSRLFMSLLPIETEKDIKIALKESGLESVIRFIQSRTHLYNQIYYHKTNRSANKLLDFCCRNLISEKDSLIKSTTYKELEDFYWTNSDELFLWNTLQERMPEKGVERDALNELLQRRLWKRVYEKTFFKNEVSKELKKKIEVQVKKIAEDLRRLEPKYYSTVDLVFSPSMKDADKSKISFFYKEDEEYRLEEKFWENKKRFQLEKINYTEIFVRIYLKRDFTSADEYKSHKQAILKGARKSINELEALLD